jgi:hypothetical protein
MAIRVLLGIVPEYKDSKYILVRNLSTICPCPESLKEAKVESNGLINFMEKISRQLTTQAVTRL